MTVSEVCDDAPLYDQVKRDLGIDPAKEGGRPKWSFAEAERRLARPPAAR